MGGLFISKPESLVQTYDLPTVSSYLKGFSDYELETDVGIIVLDQFSYALKPGKRAAAYKIGSSVYELVDAAQMGEAVLEETFTSLRERGQLSHGALVFEHVTEVLDALPYVSGSWYNRYYGDMNYAAHPSYARYVTQQTYYKSGKSIVAKAVDVADLDTELIAEALESAVASLRSQGIYKYAVNMSFSIVPCALSELARDYGTVEDYLDNLAQEAAAAGETLDPNALMNYMSWITAQTDDPLLRLFETNYGQGVWQREDIALIAAAGNFSGTIPLLPALARDVISVSSFDVPTHEISVFTNAGEVSAPGWVFKLDDSADGKLISYGGTSFSSPAVALYAALDLAQGETKCFSPGEPSDLLSYGSYDNKPLDDAVRGCTP